MIMAPTFLFVVVQVVSHGVERLVHAALLIRIAELLGYEDASLEIVPLEKAAHEEEVEWHNFDGVLVRVDSDVDNSDLLGRLHPQSIAPHHASLLDILLSNDSANEYRELRDRWRILGELVMKRDPKRFNECATQLVSWVRAIVAERITEVH